VDVYAYFPMHESIEITNKMQPCNRIYWDFPLRLDKGLSPHVYINQRMQIQFRAPDDERYAAQNMLSL
jgi:hypothetical protein